MDDTLKAEIEYRESIGCERVTVAEFKARLAALGYRMDRALDCLGNARYLTGERAGCTYPALTVYVRESDTGLSFANVDARRDSNFRKLQDEFRQNVFAVSRGAIMEA